MEIIGRDLEAKVISLDEKTVARTTAHTPLHSYPIPSCIHPKRAMVRHISHEIRTPLNITAIGMDTMLRALQKLPPTKTVSFLRETIGSCRVACDDALTIVSDLLDFEKLAAGMFTLEKVLTSLVQWVGELLKPFRVSAHSKGVTLEFVHPDAEAGQPAPVVADIDPLKMATVVRNLLSNAIKFSDTG